MDLAFRDLIGSNGSRVCKVYDSERAPGADGQRTVTVALQAPVVARVANLKNRTDLLQYGRNAHDHDQGTTTRTRWPACKKQAIQRHTKSGPTQRARSG